MLRPWGGGESPWEGLCQSSPLRNQLTWVCLPFRYLRDSPDAHTTCVEKALSCLHCPLWTLGSLGPLARRGAGGVVREWSVPALSCQRWLHRHSPAHTLAWKMPVSARAGRDLEQPLKVSRQLNLIKPQLQKPAAFS